MPRIVGSSPLEPFSRAGEVAPPAATPDAPAAAAPDRTGAASATRLATLGQLATASAPTGRDTAAIVAELPGIVASGIGRGAVADLYQAAEALAPLDESPFADFPTTKKNALTEDLLPFLRYSTRYRGRPSTVSVRSRAAASALLTQLAQSMAQPGELRRGRKIADALLAAARQEPHPGLRRQMSIALQALPTDLLTAKQIRAREELLGAVQPKRPPYDKWFEGEAQPTLDVKAYIQDEFWKKEIAAYKKAGFDVQLRGTRGTATKRMEDPTGKNPPTLVKIQLIQQDERVLGGAGQKDGDIVFYTGHSGLGSVGQWSAAHSRKTSGETLVGLFACRTKQNLNQIRGKLPDAQVLVSNNGTYGNDDRQVIQSLFRTVARRGSYDDMRADLERSDLWEGAGNYYLPDDKRQLDFSDLDRDGRAALSGDRPDILYNLDLKKPQSRSVSMQRSRKIPDPATLGGAKVLDAVSWFNTVHSYWSEDFSVWQSEVDQVDRFRADGWFRSDDPDEIVRLQEVATEDGAPVYRVKVNAAYANQDPDALGMMVSFALQEKVAKRNRPNESAYDRRMRSLAFTASYTANLVEYSDVAETLVQSFAKRFGFPPTLTWPVMEKAVEADHDHEASPKIVKLLERGMQYPFLEVDPQHSSVGFRETVQKALDELRQSPSPLARSTFDAVVSGRILVDELSDLSRPDYLRLRNEFAREGTHLPKDGFYELHDETSKVARALTQDLDGYMWDNRIYLNMQTLSPKELASTLIHEANHIFNKSEESYRGEASILREEYRAFYAEAVFRGEDVQDPAVARAIKEGVIRDYTLKTMTPGDVPDLPPGVFTDPSVRAPGRP